MLSPLTLFMIIFWFSIRNQENEEINKRSLYHTIISNSLNFYILYFMDNKYFDESDNNIISL